MLVKFAVRSKKKSVKKRTGSLPHSYLFLTELLMNVSFLRMCDTCRQSHNSWFSIHFWHPNGLLPGLHLFHTIFTPPSPDQNGHTCIFIYTHITVWQLQLSTVNQTTRKNSLSSWLTFPVKPPEPWLTICAFRIITDKFVKFLKLQCCKFYIVIPDYIFSARGIHGIFQCVVFPGRCSFLPTPFQDRY